MSEETPAVDPNILLVARVAGLDSGLVQRIRDAGRASAQRNPINPDSVYGRVCLEEVLAEIPEIDAEGLKRTVVVLTLVGRQEYVWTGMPANRHTRAWLFPEVILDSQGGPISVSQVEVNTAAGVYGPPEDLHVLVLFLRRRAPDNSTPPAVHP